MSTSSASTSASSGEDLEEALTASRRELDPATEGRLAPKWLRRRLSAYPEVLRERPPAVGQARGVYALRGYSPRPAVLVICRTSRDHDAAHCSAATSTAASTSSATPGKPRARRRRTQPAGLPTTSTPARRDIEAKITWGPADPQPGRHHQARQLLDRAAHPRAADVPMLVEWTRLPRALHEDMPIVRQAIARFRRAVDRAEAVLWEQAARPCWRARPSRVGRRAVGFGACAPARRPGALPAGRPPLPARAWCRPGVKVVPIAATACATCRAYSPGVAGAVWRSSRTAMPRCTARGNSGGHLRQPRCSASAVSAAWQAFSVGKASIRRHRRLDIEVGTTARQFVVHRRPADFDVIDLEDIKAPGASARGEAWPSVTSTRRSSRLLQRRRYPEGSRSPSSRWSSAARSRRVRQVRRGLGVLRGIIMCGSSVLSAQAQRAFVEVGRDRGGGPGRRAGRLCCSGCRAPAR